MAAAADRRHRRPRAPDDLVLRGAPVLTRAPAHRDGGALLRALVVHAVPRRRRGHERELRTARGHDDGDRVTGLGGEQRAGLLERARAVRRQRLREPRIHGGAADAPDQLVHGDRAGAALDAHQVDLAEHEPRAGGPRGALADQDRHAVLLGQRLEPGAEVDLVAEHRVVEPRGRAHVADRHRAGVEADPDRNRGLAGAGPPGVEIDQRGLHREGDVARPGGVIGQVDRRAPDRHHGVADVLVEGPARVEHELGHRRQVLAEERGQLLGWHGLGEQREPADVAEQDGQLLALAAQPHPRRIREDAIDDRAGHVLREHRAQPRLVAALGGEAADGGRQQHPHGEHGGQGEREHHAVAEQHQREHRVQRDRRERHHRRHPRPAAHPPELRAAHQAAQDERGEQRRRAAGHPQQPPAEDVLRERGVQLDAIGRQIERRGHLVTRAVGHAHEHELVGQRLARRGPGEHGGGRHPRDPVLAEHVEDQRGAARHRQLAAAGPQRARTDEVAGVAGPTFERERRGQAEREVVAPGELDREGHPPGHAVLVAKAVDRARADGARGDRGQRDGRAAGAARAAGAPTTGIDHLAVAGADQLGRLDGPRRGPSGGEVEQRTEEDPPAARHGGGEDLVAPQLLEEVGEHGLGLGQLGARIGGERRGQGADPVRERVLEHDLGRGEEEVEREQPRAVAGERVDQPRVAAAGLQHLGVASAEVVVEADDHDPVARRRARAPPAEPRVDREPLDRGEAGQGAALGVQAGEPEGERRRDHRGQQRDVALPSCHRREMLRGCVRGGGLGGRPPAPRPPRELGRERLDQARVPRQVVDLGARERRGALGVRRPGPASLAGPHPARDVIGPHLAPGGRAAAQVVPRALEAQRAQVVARAAAHAARVPRPPDTGALHELRQADEERRAARQVGLDPDPPPVGLGREPAEHQAEAVAARAAIARHVGREDPLGQLGGDAGPRVADAQQDAAAPGRGAELDLDIGRRGRVPDRVLDQVLEQAPHELAVGEQRRHAHRRDHADAVEPPEPAQAARDVVDEPAQLDQLGVGLDADVLGARQIEQVAHGRLDVADRDQDIVDGLGERRRQRLLLEQLGVAQDRHRGPLEVVHDQLGQPPLVLLELLELGVVGGQRLRLLLEAPLDGALRRDVADDRDPPAVGAVGELDRRAVAVDVPALGQLDQLARGVLARVDRLDAPERGLGIREVLEGRAHGRAVPARGGRGVDAHQLAEPAVRGDQLAAAVDHDHRVVHAIERRLEHGVAELDVPALRLELRPGAPLEVLVQALHLARGDVDRALERVAILVRVDVRTADQRQHRLPHLGRRRGVPRGACLAEEPGQHGVEGPGHRGVRPR